MNSIYSDNRLALGLMRLKDISVEELENIIEEALSMGVSFFDISDVYCRHESEIKLGEVIKRNPDLRTRMIIQSKCGIVKEDDIFPHYDLSEDHIKNSLKASLERMHLSYLDSYLLHRPDIFMDNKEISRSFNSLYDNGLVHYFGVSNMDVSQIEYLKKEDVEHPLECCQLQLGLGQLSLLSQTFNANNPEENHLNTDGLFFYIKKEGLSLQCWSPYQYGFFKGSIFKVPELKKTQDLLKELALKYKTTDCAIATSFLTDLGPFVQVITGSVNLSHIKESLEGTKIRLTKEDWYRLYASTGHLLP